jgi:hypothetical protein
MVPNADMYFLNPAGVMFGPNARLDIPKSLYISTADYLRFKDMGRFDATNPGNSLLTVAPPSAFGFLDTQIGKIEVNGSLLSIPQNATIAQGVLEGKEIPIDTLSLIGGDIKIEDGVLLSFGGNIHLTSVASDGEVALHPSKLLDSDFDEFGTITITNLTKNIGNIDASGLGGGEIFIRAGKLFLDGGYIFADTLGEKEGRGIDIKLTENLTLKNASRITTETVNELGNFNIKSTGNAGKIDVIAKEISLTAGSQIASSSGKETQGNAGDITIFAKEKFYAAGFVEDNLGKHDSGILSNTLSVGSSGKIDIKAANLMMEHGGVIRAETQGLGNAGDVSISVNRLTLFSGAQIDSSLYSEAFEVGNIDILAKEYMVIHGSEDEQASAIRAIMRKHFRHGEGSFKHSKGNSYMKIKTHMSAIADGGIIEASGTVTIDTEVDLTDNFTVLSYQPLDASHLLINRCTGLSKQNLSRFIITIRDVLPPTPEDLRTHYYIPD